MSSKTNWNRCYKTNYITFFERPYKKRKKYVWKRGIVSSKNTNLSNEFWQRAIIISTKYLPYTRIEPSTRRVQWLRRRNFNNSAIHTVESCLLKALIVFSQKPSENGRLSVCTVDRKASIVSSLYQDVSPTKPRDNVSPAPSQNSFAEMETFPSRVLRTESMRTTGGWYL